VLLRHIFIAMSIARMILESFAAKPVVWQRNQPNLRLISPCDDDYYDIVKRQIESELKKVRKTP